MILWMLLIGIVSLVTLFLLCAIQLHRIRTGRVTLFYTTWTEAFPFTSGPIPYYAHIVLSWWHTLKVAVSVTLYRFLVKFGHVAKIKIDAILVGVQSTARTHIAEYRAHHAKPLPVVEKVEPQPLEVIEGERE